jgi:hypothetical protein
MSSALLVLGLAPPLFAGPGGGATGSIQFSSQSPASRPAFTDSSGISIPTQTTPTIADEVNGFSISNFSYTATSTAANGGDATWTSSRSFSIVGTLAAQDTVTAQIPQFTLFGGGKGSVTITVSADISHFVGEILTVIPGSTVSGANTFSFPSSGEIIRMIGVNKSLQPPTTPLGAGSYQLDLVTDIHFSGSGKVTVDADFGASVVAVPEPSTLALAGIGVVTLAGGAWRRRRQR